MSKKTFFTTITPLPSFLTRETALSFLRDHLSMIDLNPLVIHRHKLPSAPAMASPEESSAHWYEITDKISYMPGVQSSVCYNACMHDLTDGLQTHTFAPAGVEIRGRWVIGGTLPGEPSKPAELGMNIPAQGLYLQEDTELKCNFLMTGFIKKNLKKSHAQVVEKIIERARELDTDLKAKPPVPPKEPGYVSAGHSRENSQTSVPQQAQPQQRPTYSTYASESNPDLNRVPDRVPAEYQHYGQETEPVWKAQRYSEHGQGRYEAQRPTSGERAQTASPPQQQQQQQQPVELPAQGSRHDPVELAG